MRIQIKTLDRLRCGNVMGWQIKQQHFRLHISAIVITEKQARVITIQPTRIGMSTFSKFSGLIMNALFNYIE